VPDKIIPGIIDVVVAVVVVADLDVVERGRVPAKGDAYG
jgi:hypothetical protein